MKRHNVILESSIEPKDKNVLWLQGNKLKKFGKTGWEDIVNEALALGAFHGYFPDSTSLPIDTSTPGYAYVGLGNPYKIWNFNGESWSDSGTYIDVNDVDEEDITRNTDGKLQFKDRAYGDGMGYVILRKDKTFAEQVTQANTIYEIRYGFYLEGEDIEIPAHCILKFVGGAIYNATLSLNDTMIHGEGVIFNNTKLSGTISNESIRAEWFDSLQNAIDFCKTRATILSAKDITLVSDTNMLGVRLNVIGMIYLNGHNLTIGGGANKMSDIQDKYEASFPIFINAIFTEQKTTGKVYIGKCMSVDMKINFFNGDLVFQVDSSNTWIGYSNFELTCVDNIFFKANNYPNGWINSNRFILNRTRVFRVESSLKMFDQNAIYGGCFEGDYEIHLEKGSHNVFRDLRNESKRIWNSTWYLGENTENNIIESVWAHLGYIYDYGNKNVFVGNPLNTCRMLTHDNICVRDYIKSIPTRFDNFALSEDSKYIVPQNAGGLVCFYETPLLELKDRDIYAILEVSSIGEPAMCVDYQLFDEDLTLLNPITNTEGAIQSFGIITTHKKAYEDNNEGFYLSTNLASGYSANSTISSTQKVSNKYICLDISKRRFKFSTDQALIQAYNKIKYVKVRIVGSAYYNTFNSKILMVDFKTYTPSMPMYPIASELINQ